MVNKTFAQRYTSLFKWYQTYIWEKDSVEIFNRIDTLEQLAKENNDADLLLETGVMKAHYYYYSYRKDKNKFPAALIILKFDSLQQEGVKQKKIWMQAWGENLKALFNFYDLEEYEKAFEHFGRMYELIRTLSPADFPPKQNCLYQLGDAHYYFREYEKAAFYMKEAFAANSKYNWMHNYMNIINTTGLCYQKLGQYDSAAYYFDITYTIAKKDGNKAWMGISDGNKGYNYFLQKDYDKAMPLLTNDALIAEEFSDWGLASNAFCVLADIHIKKANWPLAEKMLMKGRQYAYASAQYKRLQMLYPLLARYYTFKGDGKQATLFLDSSLYVKDSIDRKFSALQMLRATQKLELQKQQATLENLSAEKRISQFQRNGLIILVLLLGIMGLLVYNNQRRRYKQKQLQLEQKEKELALAEKELNDFARAISEKNKLLEILQEQVGDDNEALKQLHQQSILTTEDWEYFRKLFERVHSGYLGRLKEKLSGLSQAETRFMALAKLNLSNKEMAASLGTTPQAVRTTWYRLRKKLNLPEEGSLEELVNSI